MQRTCFAILTVTATILASVSCSTLKPVRKFFIQPDEDHQPLQRLPGMRVQEEIQPLIDEAVRVATGEISDDSTRAKVWRAREPDNKNVPALAHFAERLLREAYGIVPTQLLNSIVWSDSLPTFASQDFGIVINRQRASQLAWAADSSFFMSDDSTYARIFQRQPHDYALLMLVSHEMAHLAITFSALYSEQPQSITECVADILGAFQVSALAPRLSSSGTMELKLARIADAVAFNLAPGEWIAREEHPERTQRLACIQHGFDLFENVSLREPIAGAVLLSSKKDSLIDALALGKLGLVSAALLEAKSILSIPNAPVSTQNNDTHLSLRDPQGVRLVELFQRILEDLQLGKGLMALTGDPISTGTTLFPSGSLNELRIKINSPWHCAVIGRTEGKGQSVGCYIIGDHLKAALLRLQIKEAMLSDIKRRGYQITSIGPATTRDARVGLEQWLIEGFAGARAIFSVYTQPYGRLQVYGQLQDRIWYGQQINWVAIAPLPDPPLQKSWLQRNQ